MIEAIHTHAAHREVPAILGPQAGAAVPRMLLMLALAALLLVGAAMWLGAERRPEQEQVGGGTRLLPGLEARVNDIARVRIDGGSAERTTVLERIDGAWGVQQRGGHPADVGKLRTLLLALAQAERVEAKTANPELYERIGVDHGEAARGVLVGLAGGAEAAPGGAQDETAKENGDEKQVIVGDSAGDGTATYVRLADEAQSWLVDRAIAVAAEPSSWLRQELTQIDAHRVARVEIVHAGDDGDRVEIVAADDGPGFELANLPKGRALASASAPEATAGLLSALRLADVEPVQGEDPFGQVQTSSARFALRDGIVVDIEFFDQDEFVAAVFEATLDEERALAWIETEQAKAAMEHERVQRAQAAETAGSAATEGSGGAAASADAPASAGAAASAEGSEGEIVAAEERTPAPRAVTDPEADRAARLAALRDEVTALQQRFEGWAFRLPPYKAEHLTRPLQDYLAPKD